MCTWKREMCGSLTFLLKPWWSIWLSCFQNGFIITDSIIGQFCFVIPTNCSLTLANKTSPLSCVHARVYVRSFVHLNLNGRFGLLHLSVCFGDSDVIKELMMDWPKLYPPLSVVRRLTSSKSNSLLRVSLVNTLTLTFLEVKLLSYWVASYRTAHVMTPWSNCQFVTVTISLP